MRGLRQTVTFIATLHKGVEEGGLRGFVRVRLKKSGRGGSSSGSSGMNRSADVSNVICLTACVFGLTKKGGGVEWGAQPPPRGGLGGGGADPRLQTFAFIATFCKGV